MKKLGDDWCAFQQTLVMYRALWWNSSLEWFLSFFHIHLASHHSSATLTLAYIYFTLLGVDIHQVEQLNSISCDTLCVYFFYSLFIELTWKRWTHKAIIVDVPIGECSRLGKKRSMFIRKNYASVCYWRINQSKECFHHSLPPTTFNWFPSKALFASRAEQKLFPALISWKGSASHAAYWHINKLVRMFTINQ